MKFMVIFLENTILGIYHEDATVTKYKISNGKLYKAFEWCSISDDDDDDDDKEEEEEEEGDDIDKYIDKFNTNINNNDNNDNDDDNNNNDYNDNDDNNNNNNIDTKLNCYIEKENNTNIEKKETDNSILLQENNDVQKEEYNEYIDSLYWKSLDSDLYDFKDYIFWNNRKIFLEFLIKSSIINDNNISSSLKTSINKNYSFDQHHVIYTLHTNYLNISSFL
jgi:hypothetical protein